VTIKTEQDYLNALKRADEIWDAEDGPEADELDSLVDEICAYEEEHYPIGLPDPIEAIKIRLDDLGLKLDALPITQAVLDRQQPMTREQAEKVSSILMLPMEVLEQLDLVR
jgi:HTH-type transcriptional regulator/antitoxin HigA